MENRIDCWMQRADFSADEFDKLTMSEALAKLDSYDWSSEMARQDQMEQQGTENCPPGFGFVPDAFDILHVMPERDGRWTVSAHGMDSVKFLWIFNRSIDKWVTGVTRSDITKLIQSHYATDREGMLRILDFYDTQS